MRGTHNHIAVGLGVAALAAIFVSGGAAFDAPSADGLKHRSYSSDPTLYAIGAGASYVQVYSEPVRGGIVSHHLLANIDIAKFFAEFADQEVGRVVIIGPNHYYPTAPAILSTTRSYTTPFGDVAVDTKTVEDLVRRDFAELSPGMLEEEHSVSSLVPYVAAYFPGAQVVPLIVSAKASAGLMQEVSAYLAAQSDRRTIVVASVDFSHHLQSNAASLHDARSVAALRSFDFDSLFGLEADSPGSLYLLLKYLEKEGAQNLSLTQQSSARIFDSYDSEDVTSYVFAHARQGASTPVVGASALFFGEDIPDADTKAPLFSGIRGLEGNFLKGYDAVRFGTGSGTSVIRGTNGDIVVVSFELSVLSSPAVMIDTVRALSQSHPMVAVSLQRGSGSKPEPSAAERMLMQSFIDAGADAVMGYGPEDAGPVEAYKGRPVFYSLGDFAAGQAGQDRNGLAVGMLNGGSYARFVLFPYIQKEGIPTHVPQADARDFCRKVYHGGPQLLSTDHDCILVTSLVSP